MSFAHNRDCFRLTTGEHSRLKDSEEEASGAQSRVVLDKALEQGGQAEQEHVDAEPDMGLELLEEDVGGDLEEDVWDEEDDEGIVVLVSLEV